MLRSSNLDYESKDYDETVEQLEDVHASMVYSSFARTSKTI